jgi:hypothetical protein
MFLCIPWDLAKARPRMKYTSERIPNSQIVSVTLLNTYVRVDIYAYRAGASQILVLSVHDVHVPSSGLETFLASQRKSITAEICTCWSQLKVIRFNVSIDKVLGMTTKLRVAYNGWSPIIKTVSTKTCTATVERSLGWTRDPKPWRCNRS